MGRPSPLGIPARADLVADAAAIARRLGLDVDDPVILKDTINLLVWLRPSPVIARMQVRTGLVRSPGALADSLALAAFLAREGLAVSPPVDDVDPGPHVGTTGRAMTLWRYLEVGDAPADPAAAGHALREIHEAASAFRGSFRHVGPLEEIGRLAEVLMRHRPAETARLLDLRGALDLPDLPTQALHGDSHLGNVLLAGRGPVWVDWEESWRGPIAWDIAALDHRRRVFGEADEEIQRALAGYGNYDRDAMEAWQPVVALWAAAWGLIGEVEGLGWSDNARRRLDWVEERLAG